MFVGAGQSDVAGVSEATIGAKAYHLMRLDRLGLRVPPAIVFGTALCREFHAAGGRLPPGFRGLLKAQLRRLESVTGRHFGSARLPLLLAVRSGAAASMPGMLETVLDVGLNAETVHGLIRSTGNPRLAWDAWRRLIEGYAEVVDRVPPAPFAQARAEAVQAGQVASVRELDALALRALVGRYLALYEELTGSAFPRDPVAQLEAAVAAVFGSWRSERAREFRRQHGIDEASGTAVTAQAMVFGNQGGRSGAGVGFTRDPATGAAEPYIDFLFNAQGEDVVAGRQAAHGAQALRARLPAVAREIEILCRRLEAEYGDMQDFEFTVEEGVLWLLQTRAGKRTPWAALRIAVELVQEGLATPAQALARLDGLDLAAIERRHLRVPEGVAPLARGTPASVGVAIGRIALDAGQAAAFAAAGDPVVLVRETTSTEDIAAMAVAAGILTGSGGRTAHAAVVAREMGITCVVGCPGLALDARARYLVLGGARLAEGDWISLDGETGEVHAGRLDCTRERPEAALATVRGWTAAGAAAPALTARR